MEASDDAELSQLAELPELAASKCKKIPNSELGLAKCSSGMTNYRKVGANVKSCSADCSTVLAKWMASCELSAMTDKMQTMIKDLAKVLSHF